MSRRNSKVNDMLKEMFNFHPPLYSLSGSSQSKGATVPLMESHMEATRLNWFRQHNVIQDITNHRYPLPLPPSELYGSVNNSSGGSVELFGWQGDPEVFLGVNGLGKSSSEHIMDDPWKDELILLDEPEDDVFFMESMDSNARTDNMIEELSNSREQEQTPSRKRLNPSEDLSLENAQKRVALEHAGYYNQSAASNSTRREKGRKKMKSLQELMSQSANEGLGKDPSGYFQMLPPTVPLPLPNANQPSNRIIHQGQMVETRPWLKIRLPVPSVATTSYPLPLPESPN